jgi:hypothetical protein
LVSLENEIFPPGFPEKRHPDFVQTEWSHGWPFASIGYGEAARHLTQHRRDFQGAIDSVGLVVFYLQRHRVELRLKELLVAHGVKADELRTHSLVALWKRCEAIIGADNDEWQQLDTACGELIRVLDKYDRNSDAYRYPVNPDGERHDRPPYIELVALERHVSSFVSMIDGYTDYSDEARRYEMEMRAQFEQEMREVYGEDPFGQL